MFFHMVSFSGESFLRELTCFLYQSFETGLLWIWVELAVGACIKVANLRSCHYKPLCSGRGVTTFIGGSNLSGSIWLFLLEIWMKIYAKENPIRKNTRIVTSSNLFFITLSPFNRQLYYILDR